MELFFAIVPSLVAIILAIATKRIIPSLLAGLWVGAFLVSPGILSSFSRTVEYIVLTLIDSGNFQVLLFLYLFSGLVGLLKLSGGIEGFSARMLDFVKTRRQFLLSIWALIPLTFIDCGYRVVSTGSIAKSLSDRFGVAREKLAVMLNLTASPVISLIPIATTFMGYMVGVVAVSLNMAGLSLSPYSVFLQSIPFNIFSISVILIVLGTLIFGRGLGHYRSKKLVHRRKPPRKRGMKRKQGNPWNLLIPVVILIFLSVYLMYRSGADAGGSGLFDIFSKADAYSSMLLALFITLVLSFVIFLFQRFPAQEMTDQVLRHGNKIMRTIAILAVAWPIAVVSRDLGLPEFIVSVTGSAVPPFLLPVIIFAVTAGVGFAIGSSWGTWALLMPIAIPLASASGVPVPLVVGAVWAGGTFGDVTSPLSGMTAMAATVAESPHSKYLKAVLPYSSAAFLVSLIVYLVLGIVL